MFENPEVAQRVLQTFLHLNGQMDQSVAAVEKNVSPSEFKEFKKAVGCVMYEVFDKIVEPICERHPALRPPEMQS